MQDPIGPPRSLLLLGGTSKLGLATARRMIGRRTRTVWLAGRPGPALDAAAAELRALGARTHTVDFDALDPASHAEVLGKVFAEGPVDLVLLAFGLAGDQLNDEADPAAAARVAATNYTGAVSAGLVCGMGLQAQGHGALVVLSSVAGERVRRGDFIFGSSKAGLDAFAQGLGDALYGTGVRVLVVRPGVVRSRRQDALVPEEYANGVLGLEGPFATTPEAVAEAVERGLRRGSETVWVPAALRPVMAGLRHVPRPLFRRLPV